MRWCAVLGASLLLAGCTQFDPGDAENPEEFGSCPSWIKMPRGGQKMFLGENGQGIIFLYTNQTTQPDFENWDFMEPTYDSSGEPVKKGSGVGDGHLDYDGHPLDQLVFNFHYDGKQRGLYVQDAEARLQFFSSRDGFPAEPVEAYDETKGAQSAQTEWVFRSDPARGYSFFNITLRVDLAAINEDPDPRGVFLYWTWTFNLDSNQDTASLVQRGVEPEYWYRTCSSDGTRH